MDKKVILFGAGNIGKACLEMLGESQVHVFCDNFLAGREVCGKKIIDFKELQEIHHNYNVILSVGDRIMNEVGDQLDNAGIPYSSYVLQLRKWYIEKGEYRKVEAEGIFTDKFVEFVKNEKPKTFANVGAASGGYASIAAYFMDKSSEIFLFEPIPEFVSSLKYFFEDDLRIHVIDKAVSNQNGETELFATVKNNANNIAHSFTMDRNQTMFNNEYDNDCMTLSHKVQTITLDDFFDGKEVDLILIDIEGAEVLAIEGMEKLIKKRKTTFFLEIHEPYIKAIRSDGMEYINKVFSENNYKIYWCELEENSNYKAERGGVRLIPSEKIRWEHCIVSPNSLEDML